MNTIQRWSTLGQVEPTALTDARLQCHWAAQIVASVGTTHIAPRADDSHPNMGCDADRGWLVGNPSDTDPSFRAALDLAALTVVLLDHEGDVSGRQPLRGLTLEAGHAWLSNAIRDLTAGRVSAPLTRTSYDLPEHSVAQGAPFDADGSAAFEELARWYVNAQRMAEHVLRDVANTSSIRVWPHHFDLGAVVLLDPDGDPETARSIGIGMTPGDDSYPQPYWYVNPWPRPRDDVPLPDLGTRGGWHTAGWFGAVLTGEDITSAVGADQSRVVIEFLQAAMSADRALLDRG